MLEWIFLVAGLLWILAATWAAGRVARGSTLRDLPGGALVIVAPSGPRGPRGAGHRFRVERAAKRRVAPIRIRT